jgi:hypothetical protein
VETAVFFGRPAARPGKAAVILRLLQDPARS